jgi:hypothetical protein
MMRRILLTEGTEFTGRSGATLKVLTLPTQGYGGRLDGEISVERTFPPGKGRSLEHRHMDFDETYEILEGVADAWINGGPRRLTAGDLVKIYKGTPHVNPHSNDNTGLRLVQTIAPATQAGLAFVNTLGQLMNQGRDDDGELPQLATLAVFERLQGQTYLTQIPEWSQQKLLGPLGARFAKRRGYDVWPVRLAKRS